MAIKEIETDLELIGYGVHHYDNIKAINENFAELAGGNGGTPSAVDWADVTGKPTTFTPTIGTTATTAKAGNYVPAWNDVTGKPTTFAPAIGTTATTAMAGNTQLLTIGTTAGTAKAGNYVPTWAEVTGKPATFAPTIGTTATTAGSGADVAQLKADMIALTSRVAALETP